MWRWQSGARTAAPQSQHVIAPPSSRGPQRAESETLNWRYTAPEKSTQIVTVQGGNKRTGGLHHLIITNCQKTDIEQCNGKVQIIKEGEGHRPMPGSSLQMAGRFRAAILCNTRGISMLMEFL